MARPLNWHPLASSDPLPGSPDGLENGAAYYARIATTISDASSGLAAIESMDGFESGAVSELRARATEVRESLQSVQSRYRSASRELGEYAAELRAAQGAADAALEAAVAQDRAYHEAKDDESWWRRQAANAEYEGDEERASRYRGYADDEARAAAAALNSINSLRDEELASAVARRDTAAEEAMGAFDELTDDGLNDGWWQDWGSKVVGIISRVASVIGTVAGVLALVLCWVPVIGQALAAVALIATAVAAVADFTLALTGEEDWSAFGADVFALATFGLGRVATSAFRVRAMTRGLQGASTAARTAASGSRLTVTSTVRTISNTRVVTQTRALEMSVQRVTVGAAPRLDDVVAAKGGAVRLTADALNPVKAIRETWGDAKGISAFFDSSERAARIAQGKALWSGGDPGSRFAQAVMGAPEGALLNTANGYQAGGVRMLTSLGVPSAHAAEAVGTTSVTAPALSVAGLVAVDSYETAKGVVDTVHEIRDTGANFSSWITSENDERSAPARLGL